MEKDFSISASNNIWKAEINPGCEVPVSFSLYENELLRIQAAGFSNILSEKASEPVKSRLHESVDNLTQRIEMESLIPFGSEPRIRRTLDFYGNYCKVITDLEIFSQTPIEHISVDPVRITEPAKRLGIIQVPAVGQAVGDIIWHNEPNGTVYCSIKPFLLVLIELQNGTVLEIGTGDDLWRWQASEVEPETSSEFTIIADESGVTITRKILIWPEKTMISQRNRRSKWYFAWNDSGPMTKCSPDAVLFDFESKPAENAVSAYFDLKSATFPDFTHTTIDGEPIEFPCFHASALLKRMRKWIRSAAAASPGCHIVLQNVEAHVCDSAIHLDRGKLKTMPHWDMMSLIDFGHWADQQLQKNGGSLRLAAPSGSPAAVLPGLNKK